MANRFKSDQWEPKTPNQALLRQTILDKQIIFVSGPAGAGKTYVSLLTGLDLLDKGMKGNGVEKIVITRPLVAAGKNFGALPGDLGEKIDPFMRSVRDTLKKSGRMDTQELLNGGGESSRIEFIPLEVCRSLTFDNIFAMLDEAQNTTISQMEMFLTRCGPNSKMIVSGDTDQCDITGQNGFAHAWDLFKDNDLFGKVTLTLDDIQRAGIVREVVIAYAQSRAKRK